MILLITFLFIFILGLQKNYSPDVGFHLKSAKWMLENKSFLKTDPFTYTSYGNNYFNMQWIYQLFIYFIYKIGKDNLLVVINALLITFAFFLVWLRIVKQEKNNYTSVVFLFVIIISTQPLLFEIRPHVFSWVYLGLLSFILEQNQRGKSKYLFCLPLIMVLWVNSHSLSILGLALIAIYSGFNFYFNKEAFNRLLKFSIFSVLVFFINPYFHQGFIFPFSQFAILKGDAVQKMYIGELQSPFVFKEFKEQGFAYLLNPLFYLQFYSLTAIFISVKQLLKKKSPQVFAILAFFVILCLGIKNYGYFLIISLPFVITFFSARLEEQKKSIQLQSKKLFRFQISAIIMALALICLCINDGYKILVHSPYRFGASIDEQSVPVEATRFLNEQKISGKLLNHLDFGGYLMFNYSEKVFIDGRLELGNQTFYKKYFNSQKPSGFKDLLYEYDPDIIIFPYIKASGWWQHLLKNKSYKPVYFDGLSAVYLKKDKYVGIPEINKNTLNIPIISSNDLISEIQKSDKPSRFKAVLNGLLTKQYFPIDEQNKATFCFTYGYDQAALYYSYEGLKKSTINPANLYYNLALYFEANNRASEAALCRKRSGS